MIISATSRFQRRVSPYGQNPFNSQPRFGLVAPLPQATAPLVTDIPNTQEIEVFGRFLEDLRRYKTQYGIPYEFTNAQKQAMYNVYRGINVLAVMATGSGKTEIAQHAADKALTEKRQVIYTAPTKALVNEKLQQLSQRFGPDRVGLLTGDRTINRDAEVLCVTTEILEQMLQTPEQNTKLQNATIILDEIHYLAEPERGGVWNRIIQNRPADAKMLYLSASIGNPQKLANWLASLDFEIQNRTYPGKPLLESKTVLVMDSKSPVPKSYSIALLPVKTATTGDPKKFQLIRLNLLNPQDLQKAVNAAHTSFFSLTTPAEKPIVKQLLENYASIKYPHLFMAFSIGWLEKQYKALLEMPNLSLTNDAEKDQVKKIIQDMKAVYFKDTKYQPYLRDDLYSGLQKGLVLHHGKLSQFEKLVAEKLIQLGLAKVILATDTLATGINTPIEGITIFDWKKPTSEEIEPVTSGTVTQAVGRAGRSGYSKQGDVIFVLAHSLNEGELPSPSDVLETIRRAMQSGLHKDNGDSMNLGLPPEPLKCNDFTTLHQTMQNIRRNEGRVDVDRNDGLLSPFLYGLDAVQAREKHEKAPIPFESDYHVKSKLLVSQLEQLQELQLIEWTHEELQEDYTFRQDTTEWLGTVKLTALGKTLAAIPEPYFLNILTLINQLQEEQTSGEPSITSTEMNFSHCDKDNTTNQAFWARFLSAMVNDKEKSSNTREENGNAFSELHTHFQEATPLIMKFKNKRAEQENKLLQLGSEFLHKQNPLNPLLASQVARWATFEDFKPYKTYRELLRDGIQIDPMQLGEFEQLTRKTAQLASTLAELPDMPLPESVRTMLRRIASNLRRMPIHQSDESLTHFNDALPGIGLPVK
jgi:superfamily II DNA/RNA helicase